MEHVKIMRTEEITLGNGFRTKKTNRFAVSRILKNNTGDWISKRKFKREFVAGLSLKFATVKTQIVAY